MSTTFTPVESGIGGALIGLSAFVAYQADGKIIGISGILGPFLRSVVKCELGNELWKLWFLVGLFAGGFVNFLFNQPFAFPGAEPYSISRYAVAGLVLGLGTRFQRGCTSGHGICGLPRFSMRSLLAVPTFMLFAGLVVYMTRHVMKLDQPKMPGIASLEWPPRLQFPACAVAAAVVLTVLSFSPLPSSVHGVISPLASGTIFGLGLGVAGMTNQEKVLNFLDVAGFWDPSLMFVMGCGMMVSFPAFYLAESDDAKPKCAEKFEKPGKTGDYGTLVVGAVLFGIGWGLVGICPGPGLAGVVPNLVTSDGGSGGYGFALCTLLTAVIWVATDRGLQTAGPAPSASDQKPLLHK
ncbi:unnamed protein product [Durusdinium trenchii]|uniref:Sulphur transport domain-containing protein n=1 Tax=Durusdinium trenchii TaxID=1381693 RepID=A0ABP0IKA6_9DINO